jgi:hypothetical protein
LSCAAQQGTGGRNISRVFEKQVVTQDDVIKVKVAEQVFSDLAGGCQGDSCHGNDDTG